MSGKLASNSSYRPDIDGLRAVAVLLVILFHAGLGFPGGYVGVDVFFVISGYLITGIIVREVESERGFSLARFWQRRIHRILPPAAAMVLVVLLVSPFLLRPGDLESLAKSAIAQTVMAANIRFARMPNGYFDTSSELWPLLHTWSLAVEEQFYLLYPVILAFLLKRSRKLASVFIWSVVLVSLAGSIVLTPIKPEWSFYLLPTRAWELGLGAALAVRSIPPLAPVWSGVCSLVGLGCILAATFLFDGRTPFPGMAALLPCIGASLIVGTQGPVNRPGRLWLDNRAMVGIGLVSYSLYLWHWPVLAMLRYYYGVRLDFGVTAFALVLMAAMSLASYRWIEQPLRQWGQGLRPVGSARVAVVISSLVLVLALPAWRTGGWNVGARRAADSFVPRPPSEYRVLSQDAEVGEGDSLWRPLGADGPILDYVLWGDSHAQAVAPAFDKIGVELGLSGALFQKSASIPIPGIWRPLEGARGRKKAAWAEQSLDEILLLRPKVVVIVARWTSNIVGAEGGSMVAPLGTSHVDQKAAADAVRSGLLAMKQRLGTEGIRLCVIMQPPRHESGLERRLFASNLWARLFPTLSVYPRFGIARSEFVRQHELVASILRYIFAEDEILKITDVGGDYCIVVDARGRPFYWDDNHLSAAGVETMLEAEIRRVLQSLNSD